MFTKLRIMCYLNHDAADWETLFDNVCPKNAHLYLCLQYLESHGYIVRELPDTDAEYYRRSYKGAFRDYIMFRIHPFASVMAFLLAAASVVIGIISLCQ